MLVTLGEIGGGYSAGFSLAFLKQIIIPSLFGGQGEVTADAWRAAHQPILAGNLGRATARAAWHMFTRAAAA